MKIYISRASAKKIFFHFEQKIFFHFQNENENKKNHINIEIEVWSADEYHFITTGTQHGRHDIVLCKYTAQCTQHMQMPDHELYLHCVV